MNKVVLMGRFCFEPELKTTNSGIEVLSSRIAVPRSFSKDGERISDFINIVAWRKTAVFISQYFTKGDGIVIEGTLQTKKFTTDDGTEREKVEVIVERVDFPMSNKTSEENRQPNAKPSEPSAPIDVDDDIPF